MTQINFPNDSHRLVITGSTGSGKTQAGIWHLAYRSYDKKPWIIFDFKGDELIDSLPAHPIDVGFIPKKSGLYVVQPGPEQESEIDEYLKRIWQRENIGLYFDEGYMIGQRSVGFNRILTQGRSKHIPCIILSQRPVWLSRFVFSEASFFQIFRLTDIEDRKSVRKMVPYNIDKTLPEYNSVYYDVGTNKIYDFGPVPEREKILDIFEERVNKGQRRFL